LEPITDPAPQRWPHDLAAHRTGSYRIGWFIAQKDIWWRLVDDEAEDRRFWATVPGVDPSTVPLLGRCPNHWYASSYEKPFAEIIHEAIASFSESFELHVVPKLKKLTSSTSAALSCGRSAMLRAFRKIWQSSLATTFKPMNAMQTIAAVISSSGLLIFLLAIPMVLRRVPPNRLYGVRTKASFASDDDWYRINAIGGRYLAVAGLVILVVGIVGFFLPESAPDSYIISAAAITWLAVVIPCLRLCLLKPITRSK
jgi:hypothetical protein